MNNQPIVTANQVYFPSGTIITVNMIEKNGGNWLGHPKDFLVNIFIKTRKVETVNRFLTDIDVPWRVSEINIVDGQPQWTAVYK
jgi:hypothetical protein